MWMRNCFLPWKWVFQILLIGLVYSLLMVSVFLLSKEMTYTAMVRNTNATLQLPRTMHEMLPNMDWEEVTKLFGKMSPSKLKQFEVTIDPGNLCADKDLFLFIYIHTAPDHFLRRTLIRKTFANPANFAKKGIKISSMFVVGMVPENPSVQKALLEESALTHDILQENFQDTYRNLSYKGLAALKYITKHCQHVTHVLKSDDDMFVNIFTLVRHLQILPSYRDMPEKNVLCYIWRKMRVIREPQSKWYTTKEEWEPDFYYNYCSGSAFVLTPKAAKAMYEASFISPFCWVDDFYISGVLTSVGGVNMTAFHGVYKLHFDEFAGFYENNLDVGMTYIFSHVHNLQEYAFLWNLVARAQGGQTVSYYRELRTPEPTTLMPKR